MMPRPIPPLIAFIAMTLLLTAPGLLPTIAQGQCPPVSTVIFPLAGDAPRLTQAFAAQNARFHGRFHTGEDWIADQDALTLGLPVLAAAGGRVTFSSPGAWGRDGGVVILEHTLPDGTLAYTMYGHLTEDYGHTFPAAFTCVDAGQVIGGVADVRPAPHLHWEVRASGSNVPGAGYSWRHPAAEGLQAPSRWLTETATALHPAFAWRAALDDVRGDPVVLPGGDLIAVDGGRVIGLSFDGRVLWRYTPEAGDPLAALPTPESDMARIIFTDGRVQAIAADGSPGGVVTLAVPGGVQAAFNSADGRVYLAADTTLTAFDAGLNPVWTAAATGRVTRLTESSGLVAIMTEQPTGTAALTVIDRATGAIRDEAALRERGSLAVLPPNDLAAPGGLVVYTLGGLWRIDEAGTWSFIQPAAAGGGRAGAVAWGDDGVDDGWLYTFNGTIITAWNRQGVPQWTGGLPTSDQAAGLWPVASWMAERNDRLYLIAGSALYVLDAGTGALCTTVPVQRSGDWRVWAGWDEAGTTLRVAAGGTVTGLDGGALRRACG